MWSWDYTTTFIIMRILNFWHWAEIITTEFELNLREDKALCYHGILQRVVSKRLFCSFGSELRLQLLILHHHHIDPLFHPLQLVLTSGRRKGKEMWKQKRNFQLPTFACEHTLHNLTSASRCWMYSDWLWLIGTRSLDWWILDLSCFFTEESQTVFISDKLAAIYLLAGSCGLI